MKSTLKYSLKIISILLLWCNALFIVAEENNVARENEDPKKLFYGFSVDFDLGEPFLHVVNSNRFGMNASVQADFLHTFFPVFEMGYSTYEGASYLIEQPGNYSYQVNGTYYKIGVDFNILSKDYTKKVIALGYLGIRYCISPFDYRIENLPVNDFYWSETPDYKNPQLFDSEGSSTGQWAEFAAGVKTPIYKNFCLGVSLRFKQFLSIKEKREGNKTVRSSYTPGYGEKENDTWGFRYTISYFFPFAK
jgi:hypothetical protein